METTTSFNKIFGAAVLGAIIFFAGCGDEILPGNTSSGPPAVVKAAISLVKMVAQPQFYEAAGTISARTTATVSAKVMGEIRKVRVQEGDQVAAGDVLVEIDDSRLTAALQQAEAAQAEAVQASQGAGAALTAAQASADLAEKTYRRYEMLFKSESVSLQEFDEVKSRYDQAIGALSQAKSMKAAAENRISQAKAALNQAKSAFNDATVTAPYDARVTGRLVDEGDLAAPGVPLIQLETRGATEVQMALPETHIGHVRVGDRLSVVIPSLQNAEVTGIVQTVNSAADPATRSFRVKVSLPEAAGIQAGMFARVRVPVGETQMILIPETAVRQYGQLSGVYIVDAGDIARFRLIRPGRSVDGRVEVIAGLKIGDRYVADPDPSIVDGVKVEVS